MSKYKVTVKVEKTFELHASSALVAISRVKQLIRMTDPKGKLSSIRCDKSTEPQNQT